MNTKKTVKIVVVVLILALVGGASFLTFSSDDSGGLRQGLIKKKASTAPTPAANTQQIAPLLTIESYDAGTGSDLISEVRLEFGNPLCDVSSYRPIGHWILTSNMDMAVRGFKGWTSFGSQMDDYKVLVGTEPNSKNRANYEISAAPNFFNALMPGTTEFMLQAGQTNYVTFFGKYKVQAGGDAGLRTGDVAMKEQGVIGDFVGTAGNRIPIVTQYVRNNQANFTAGFTKISPYDGLSCNLSE